MKDTETKSNGNKATNDSQSEDDIEFEFFSGDDKLIDSGIGITIDPNLKFNHTKTDTLAMPSETVEGEGAIQEAEVPPTVIADVEPEVVTIPAIEEAEQYKFVPSLNIYTDEIINEELVLLDTDNLKEKSAKLFADTRAAMNSYKFNSDLADQKVPPQFKGSIDIEDVVEHALLSMNIDKLIEDYEDQSTPVKQEIVEVDKVTVADRTGKAVNWLTQTFIVSPVKGLFKALNNWMKDLFGFLGSILKFLLISTIATIGIYIVMAHYSDSGQTAYEMASQHYEAVKGIAVAFYKDISHEVRGKSGQ